MPAGDGKQASPHLLVIMGNAIVGGMENYVCNLLGCLQEATFRITLIAPYESAMTHHLRDQGYDLHVMPIGDEPAWRSIQMATTVIRAQQIDVIHAHLPNAHGLAAIAGALTQRPAVATMHGMALELHELSIQRAAGTHLITVCEQAYNHARSLGVAACDLSLIYNGVDARRFAPGDGTRFRDTLGIPHDVPLVGFVGRLSHEKGPDLFLKAAGLIASHHEGAHFVLVGTGPMEAELRTQIGAMQLGERAHLAGQWAEMPAVYPAFDLLVQTSHIEGMPLVLLEGMAAAKPVVALGVGGVVELVQAEKTGLISRPGDWQDAAWNCLSLLNDDERRQQMGTAARRRILDHFTLERSAQKTDTLFRRLMERRRRRQRAARLARREVT